MILLAVPVLAAWALGSKILLERSCPTVVAHQEPLGPMVPTFADGTQPAVAEHHYSQAA